MSNTQKKSGRSRFSRRKIAKIYHESADKVGKHFSDNFVSRIQNVHEVRLWVIEWVLLVTVVFLLSIVQIMWYGDSYENDSHVAGGTFTEAVMGEVDSMNPLYADSSAEKTLGKLLFAYLVSPDASGHSKAELAESVKMDTSGRIWTVKLRDGLTWSDGEPITAEDLIYTVELIRDPTAKTTISADFSRVAMKKVDDLTVEFTLPSTYVDFMDTLEFPLVPKHILGEISPALVFESDFSTKPIGSGPFVLNVMQVTSATSANTRTIYLNRNENYYWPDTKLDSFVLKTYTKQEDIIEALNSAEVTATAELGIESRDKINKNISAHDSVLNAGVFAFLNTRSDVLSKVKVRQAIRRGVDMNVVRSGFDTAQYLDYPILQRQEALNYPGLPEYNLDEARQMIADAGYKVIDGKVVGDDGIQVTLNVAVQKRDTLTTVTERFVEELKKIGFIVTLNIYDETQIASDFFSTIVRPRDYDILFYEVDLGVSADPFVYYSSTQASAGGWNFSNYSNGLVDDALLSAHVTTNMNIRKTKYESFLKSWVEDVPSIAIYQSNLRYYYNENAKIFSDSMILTDTLDRLSDVRYWMVEQGRANITP